MAAYTEIRNLYNDANLRNRIDIATTIYAESLISAGETPSANEVKWANKVFDNPRSESKKVLIGILANFNALDVSAITGATDTQLQNATNTIAAQLVIAFGSV